MRTILKKGFILMISLFIAGNLITVAQNNVSAKEKTADSNNVTRKDNQEYNFPEDIIEPGPELPMYLYPPSIEKITNTMNGIKIQWKKVENADGYRIQRKTGKDKWKDLKILKKNKYTDNAVRNGQNYRYRVYAYAVNSVDFIENTGIKSITKNFLYLQVPSIKYSKKSRKIRCKISWKQNKKADGYTVVREIGGHGVGLQFHEDPFVSYVSEPGTGMVMAPGMMFTIEPMVNMGTDEFYVDEVDEWQIYTEDGQPSAQWEVQVLVTEDGYELIAY